MSQRFAIACACWLVLAAGPGASHAAEPAKAEAAEIEALIDQLASIADADVGYSATMTGSAFTPLDAQGQFHAGLRAR